MCVCVCVCVYHMYSRLYVCLYLCLVELSQKCCAVSQHASQGSDRLRIHIIYMYV